MKKIQIQKGVLVKYTGDDTCVTVPEGVRVIGDGAFSKCENLQKIIIPEGVRVIENGAFCGCKNLQEIELPASLNTIEGGSVFLGCKNLRTINVSPDNPYFSSEEGFLFNKNKTVLLYMFQRKETVSVPDGVEYISESAFKWQVGVKEITIPDSVTEIAEDAFESCSELCKISLSPNNPYFSFEDGILYGRNKTYLLWCNVDKAGDVCIPDSVIKVCDWAFAACDIHSITIPDSVQYIGEWAFWACHNLKSITVPDSVEAVSDTAFGRCDSLKTLCLSKNSTLTEEDLCLPKNCELVRI